MEAFRILGLQYHHSPWLKYMEKLIDLWEISRTSVLRKEYLTTKEWFERMEIEFPISLEAEAKIVITNMKDLERTGIFEDLEFKVKAALKIEDELEQAHHNWDKLDSLEKAHIKILLHTEKIMRTHPYYPLIENTRHDELAF